ncbi:meiosis-specific kinetochore protein [Thamnophis elegans]|uniref:meiosis-specific kinetochore protein n=1 Tax=Thamnophis elegans TaxID=35005 RepID=UPI0013776722|nr:meiosis-specific kinetochore protein [Thamnophis elegans]
MILTQQAKLYGRNWRKYTLQTLNAPLNSQNLIPLWKDYGICHRTHLESIPLTSEKHDSSSEGRKAEKNKMDWMKLRSYAGKRQMQKKIRCASPLPAKTAPVAMARMKSKAKTSQEHPNLLSKFSCDPQVKSTVGKKKGKMKSIVTKALPKIQEYSDVTQMVCPSSEERIELNCSEYRVPEVTKNINDMKTTPLKDSLHLASASTQSLRYSDATSGMTLPTGVSDFLLECLDMETTLDCSYTTTIDSTSSYSSPEIFRDETGLEPLTSEDTVTPETHHACKNSTLLDTSKAINVDKMSQLPNLSKILGKQVCKILSANEKGLKSQPSGGSLLLPERKKKIEDQQPVKRKCRKKITFENVCSISSPHVPSFFGKNSSKEMCGIVASKPSDADMIMFFYFIQYLRSPPEICSIIQASPGFKPLKVLQHPTNRKEGFLPPEATEDIITSSKYWTCGNDS